MGENELNTTSETDVKNRLMKFYRTHQDECDRQYADAMDHNKFNIYEEIEDDNIKNVLFLKTEVAILTANTFEKNVLHLNAVKEKSQKIYHYMINSSNNPRRPLNINVYFFEMGDFHIVHMEAKQTGSYSMGGSADIVRYILSNECCFPSVVISYGICFGNDCTDQEIGDTIIVDKLYPYFMSAKVDENFFIVKDNNIFNIDPQLDARLQHLIGQRKLSESDRVFYGHMVTGEAVISNAVMKDIFIKAATNQQVLGGEMEGYGLFKECQGFECLIPCMVVKSICDWGVYKNLHVDEVRTINLKDKLQAYAANQACKVLTVLLKKDSKMFGISIYEQVKQLIYKPNIQEGGLLNFLLMKKILNEEVHTPKKIENIDIICDMILEGLEQENIITYIRDDLYQLGEKI